MQISLKFIRLINHARITVCIKFQLLMTFSSLFTGSSSLSVFPRSVLYIPVRIDYCRKRRLGRIGAGPTSDEDRRRFASPGLSAEAATAPLPGFCLRRADRRRRPPASILSTTPALPTTPTAPRPSGFRRAVMTPSARVRVPTASSSPSFHPSSSTPSAPQKASSSSTSPSIKWRKWSWMRRC